MSKNLADMPLLAKRNNNVDDTSSNEGGQEHIVCKSLQGFDLSGWSPDSTLSEDENYMDLVLVITRSSACQIQGHVASLLVDPTLASQNDNVELKNRIFEKIIGAATNSPLFHEADSDIHAEIACLGQACQNRRSTKGCTAYITIPPCKRCFAALVTFGIKRIVSRQSPPALICDAAKRHGIDVIHFTQDMNRRQMKRINELFNKGVTDHDLMDMAEKRKKWREAKRSARKNKSTNDLS